MEYDDFGLPASDFRISSVRHASVNLPRRTTGKPRVIDALL